jgi:signal transduction histidine kinase
MAAFWFALTAGAAERTALWRVFPAGELPTMSVTLGPRGRIIARQGDGAAVTILDGYSTRPVTLPEATALPGRVYESRSGQLWMTHAEGLWLFQRGQWTRYAVAEIRQEQMKPFRSISLVPAEVNRVLFLLPGRLMEFDATSARASVVKTAAETRIGQFSEMSEASDGGLLVSGANGIARVAGPLRHLTPATPWQEFLIPTNSVIENLQRPFEGRDGAITTVGFDRTNQAVRHILTAGATEWASEEVVGEKLRLAWSGWGDTRWGMSYNGLFRSAGPKQSDWVREGSADTYFDVAVQTNGVFWMATSSGLIRYAPLLWRAPSELSAARLAETPCLAMAQGESATWLATSDGLVRVQDGIVQRFAWPNEFEATLAGIESIYETEGGRVLIATAMDMLLFKPDTREFSRFANNGGPRHMIGQLRDRSVCVPVNRDGVAGLERFNGQGFMPLIPSLPEIGVSGDVLCAMETADSDLWLGGSFGVARYKSREAKAQIFGAAEGISPERIQCLTDIGDNRLWAGGVDSIFELRGARWERVKTGFERVRSIARAREGAVWVGSYAGAQEFASGVWISHNEEEGLPSLTLHGLSIDPRGRVWVATARGAAVYFSDADTEEPRTLTPSIVENENEESRGITARLNGVDKWNYTPVNRLLYAYRLDEGTWSPFTNVNTVSFQNLSAGPHYLQARAMDRNGNQDPSTATLEFAVTLPWSRDPRLLGVVVLGVIAILFFAGLAINRHLQLMRSYAEVERKVAERTAQLEKANQELLHSQKMRALGTLAAGIAHDFNNILSIIKGSAQIIENNSGDKEKVLTRASRIQTVVEQGAGIVRSMLGMGKVGDFTECDAAELMDESIRLLGDRFPPQVQVRYEKIGEAPRFNCSKGVIHQILLNLILNAVDASSGEGTILLRTRVLNDPGASLALNPAPAPSYLAVDVIDKGVGIAPEVLPRIFEPFYTTKGFSSRRGTGLGLSMVYELAKGLGYGLSVASRLGEGSAFTVLVPLEQNAKPQV